MAKPSLVLVGHFATGKSAVAQRLAKSAKRPLVEIGDIVRDDAARSGSSSVLEHAAKVIMKGDRLKFVIEALTRASRLGKEPYIIVGVRTLGELDFLRSNLDAIFVVALTAADSIRQQRWTTRSRVPEFDWETRDAVERSWGLDDVVLSADKVIEASPGLLTVVNEVESAWVAAEVSRRD